MRRIPHDVLLEIFCACLPSEHNAVIDPAEAPLILGRICKHWRSVAYSAPILWSTLHIPSPNYDYTPSKIRSKLETIVEEWLKRSATCPLSVSFFGNGNQSHPLDKHPLVLLLCTFSQRLRHLTLTADPELIRPLLQLGSNDLPVLESLVVECTARVTDFPNSAFNLSTLKNVAICMAAPVDPRLLPLAWGQLTKLRLECGPLRTAEGRKGGLDLGGAFSVLRKCPVLVHCEFRVTVTSRFPDSILDTSPVTLPHLQTLTLKGRMLFEKWTSFLVAPNLRSLQAQSDQLSSSGQCTESSVLSVFISFRPLVIFSWKGAPTISLPTLPLHVRRGTSSPLRGPAPASVGGPAPPASAAPFPIAIPVIDIPFRIPVAGPFPIVGVAVAVSVADVTVTIAVAPSAVTVASLGTAAATIAARTARTVSVTRRSRTAIVAPD
ncbi:hypothetical protein MSAN_00569200 [Mycena sanguinolenta]|uniref:F-box domain-containing protein n=1 Tax=Mycena sanguinolenta TaxID=230812 RepID=A0A8H7DIK0_9AGAR|nr:hypothetical protein MSAN_00569200 [Mycena sanguinolenta]